MQVGKRNQGFTIVELLIVVVVIAILAAITIVSFNGIQSRAQASAISSDLAQNSKLFVNAANVGGAGYWPSAVMTNGLSQAKFDTSKYKVISYCANANEYVVAVQTTAGKKYYQKNGVPAVNDDGIDAFLPCAATGVSGAYTTHLNLPTQCAAETGTCTFSGTATVVYGSAAQGRFNRLLNATSPQTCHHASLGISDPSPGFVKACYVYPN